MKHSAFFLAVSALASLATACTSSAVSSNPRVVSSSHQSSYVDEYPASLEGTVKTTIEQENRAKATIEAMPGYTKELKGADAARVLAVVNAADESGRSTAYIERAKQLAASGQFFEEEREGLGRRVVGAAQSKMKESQCEADIGGQVTYALKDGVDRQMEKRLRARNEGHAVLERYKSGIGRDNAADLDKQSDAIAQASYTVYVALPENRARLSQLMTERDDVASTMERVLEEERVYQAEKGRTDAEKRASVDRVASIMKGKATLQAFSGEAERLAKNLDEQIPQFQKAYDDAIKTIRTQLTPR